MARPHCMFIQNQGLPWQTGLLPGSRATLQTRLLSQDSASGALTAIVQLPAGWQQGNDRCLDVEEECLVLAGELNLNGDRYGPMGYCWLPAHYPRTTMGSTTGATLLVMLSGAGTETTTTPGADYDRKRLTLQADPAAEGLETWTENPYTRYLLGTGVRPLREDPDTGEISMLYTALPFRYMAKRWTHPVVQEMFVLAGEYAINDVGLMCRGAYAWWEPNQWHGPYGSHTGFMMFIRSHGGPLSNTIADEHIDVDYHPPYNPKLPQALAPYAQEPVGTTLF